MQKTSFLDHLACCDGEWLHGYLGCNRFHSPGLGDWKDNAALKEWEYNAFGGAGAETEEIEARGDEAAAERNMKEAAAREADENGHDTMSMHSLLETLKWQDYGHEWLNKRVVRDYGANGSNQGTITKWIPADRKGPEENMALWHVVFDDDDAEDLEKGEVEEALLLHASKQNKLASKKKTQLASKQNKLASAAKKLIKKAAAKKAAKEAAAKEAEAKQEAAKQEAARSKKKQEQPSKRAKQQRKRKRENHPIKTPEVVTDEKIEANILSWLNPLKYMYAKPRDKNKAALAALKLKSVPKTKREVEAAYRRASRKYHSDKIPADFSTRKTKLYTEAFKELEGAKELVMNKICE
jgi:hypothetical protein